MTGDRYVHRRRAVRLLVVDETDRILLFLDSDLFLDPVPHWWITPGGGVDHGESDLDTAIRELHEETGLRIGPADLVGPIATRHVVHGYADQVVHQDEVYFLVNCGSFHVDTAGHTDEEQATIADIRWWTRKDLSTTHEEIWPRQLLDIWALADTPAAWESGPVDLGSSEESTVPA